MLKCNEECTPICDFCIFFDFNGKEMGGYKDVYDGHGVCWNPDDPRRTDPLDGCSDFICSQIYE